MNTPSNVRPRVLIIGCGFGGLEAARALSKAAVDITLIDRTNHHLFQPLLYQVATANVSAPVVSGPIRHVLRQQIQRGNLTVLQAEVTGIDATAGRLVLDDGAVLAYDHLIVAAGATHSYFGHDEWARVAPGLKTLADAFDIRSRIIGAFERAERCTDPAERQHNLNFVIIGGGPTGVELAGALVEIARHTLPGEFRHIDPRQARVVLVEGSDRLLGAFDPALSESARRQLQKLGAEVMTGCRVTHIDEHGIEYLDNARPDARPYTLPARTVLWGAGVAASPLGRALKDSAGAELDRAGRVIVAPDLSLPGHPEISVIGDLAAAKSHPLKGGEPKPVPGVSPAAKQMGRHAARNLLRRLAGQPTQPFHYQDYGSLATIGRKAAVVQLEGPGGRELQWSGYFAWLFWLFAHIYFLIGFRNRLVVMADWAWSYWTFERHARVVAQPPSPTPATPQAGS
jgi:NADH dehydrogenase